MYPHYVCIPNFIERAIETKRAYVWEVWAPLFLIWGACPRLGDGDGLENNMASMTSPAFIGPHLLTEPSAKSKGLVVNFPVPKVGSHLLNLLLIADKFHQDQWVTFHPCVKPCERSIPCFQCLDWLGFLMVKHHFWTNLPSLKPYTKRCVLSMDKGHQIDVPVQHLLHTVSWKGHLTSLW